MRYATGYDGIGFGAANGIAECAPDLILRTCREYRRAEQNLQELRRVCGCGSPVTGHSAGRGLWTAGPERRGQDQHAAHDDWHYGSRFRGGVDVWRNVSPGAHAAARVLARGTRLVQKNESARAVGVSRATEGNVGARCDPESATVVRASGVERMDGQESGRTFQRDAA